MQRFTRTVLGLMLATGSWWMASPALAANFHVAVIRPAASPATRSSASRLSARANAHANNAAGNPYVNPNVAAGSQTSQTNASANANAAEIREPPTRASQHPDVITHG
ncbi:MAG TPA: hypothetical protein VHX18_06505 [Rhizomicrobium sp.]|jgi:hypothetical protein|nr:hypothetical protein [Rhizomicrobium sp.]